MKKSKTFYIESLGCAKNQVDSEIIVSKLVSSGWKLSSNPLDATLIIVNTCGFIKPAKEESIDTIMAYRDSFPDKKILMTGCLSQRYAEEMYDEFREVDGFFGNTGFDRIADVAAAVIEGTREKLIPEVNYTWTREYSGFEKREMLLSPRGSAYLKVSEGCDNRCTFCAIPIIRGRLRSRTIKSVVDEFKYLLDRGVFEINLIAQDLGSFGRDRREDGRSEFLDLLEAISSVEGNFWVRLLYFHPDNFDREITGILNSDKRIVPYLDLPFQHASKRILRRMGRRGDSSEYLELITFLRESVPDIVIRSTFLVGFPGERDEDFKTLTNFQERAKIDWVGIFEYSPEENTPAYSFEGRVEEKVVRERREILETNQVDITEKRMERFVGRRMEVLLEEDIGGGNFIGRAYHQAPEVDGIVIVERGKKLNSLDDGQVGPGRVVRVRITGMSGFDLNASLEDPDGW